MTTCLSSKIVSGSSNTLSPLAVEAVLKIIDPKCDTNVDLRDIRVTKKVSGTIDDTELIDGICFTNQKPSHSAGGPSRLVEPKIALL